MKSLIGYLKKTLLLISLFLFFFHFSPIKAYSQEPIFTVNTYFEHTINDSKIDSKVIVQLSSNITRVLSIYTTTIEASNITPKCFINNEEIKCDRYNRGALTDIQIDMKNRVIPANEPFEITFRYSMENNNDISYIVKSNVLDSTTKEVVIKYPSEKGNYSWSSEIITSKTEKDKNIVLTVKNPTENEISIYFTKAVQYKFSVNRVFSNSTEQNQTFELILPSDSEIQSVLWEDISPLPTFSATDDDGNYIFSYIVKPSETVNCNITGYIQNNESLETEPNFKPYLTNAIGHWEILDSVELKRVLSFMKDKGLTINVNAKDIKLLKEKEQALFYKYLYQYIIYRLDYPKDIKLGEVDSKRSGANSIIKDSTNATPIDYADFYIALLRHFSIPSRLVLGYISDISKRTTDGYYHYWVQYYDFSEKKWISSDPFTEEFSKKSFYGNMLPDHIEVIRRGKNPMSPNLSFYSTTDFQISLATEQIKEKDLRINTSYSLESYDVTKNHVKSFLGISNIGNIAISNIDFMKSNIGEVTKFLDSVNYSSSSLLLPKQNVDIQINIPIEKISSSKIYFSGNAKNTSTLSQEFYVESDIPDGIPTYVNLLSKILSFVFFSTVLIIGYLIYKTVKKLLWTH